MYGPLGFKEGGISRLEWNGEFTQLQLTHVTSSVVQGCTNYVLRV